MSSGNKSNQEIRTNITLETKNTWDVGFSSSKNSVTGGHVGNSSALGHTDVARIKNSAG